VTRVAGGVGLIALSLLCSAPARAQGRGATLAGRVSAGSGAPVASAAVSLASAATGRIAHTRTDSTGRYTLSDLAPGAYQLVVAADGYDTTRVGVTVTSGAPNTADVTLQPTLSLGDLGFSPAQTQGSAAEQARLNRRSHMLQVHQRLGLITAVPLLATVITGAFAGGRATHKTDRDVHLGLGVLTTGLYLTTASYAIFAPKIPGTKSRGPIRIHKLLAWIHGPGMILTPILGAMAYSQRSRGERVHGIARQHGLVGAITAAAYGAALLSLTFKF
jgi:Carboxypeptidase regulatory-like domain